MSRIFFAGHDRGAGQLPVSGFPRPAYGADTAPPFYAYSGRISNNPHESMEPRCVLPSMRIISVPADCTRSQLGAGRNRYVRIIVRRKLLYAGSTEDHRNASAAQSGAAEFYSSLFHFGNHRINNITIRSKTVSGGQFRTPPPHNPVRRSLRYVTVLRGCSHAAQKSKPRLSVAANKSCLQGRTFKIWSCAPAPYGKGTHVCAALTGGRIIAAPFLDKNPIFIYPRSDGRETLNRRSAHHKHKIAKGSNPTGGGTAVTSPTSRSGGTELRLFHFWDLSLAPPTNRNMYRSKEPPRRMG